MTFCSDRKPEKVTYLMNGRDKNTPKDFSQYLLNGLTDSHDQHTIWWKIQFPISLFIKNFKNISKPRRNNAKILSIIVLKQGRHWSASRSVNISIFFPFYCVILVTVQQPLTKTITLIHRKQYGGSKPEVVLYNNYNVTTYGILTIGMRQPENLVDDNLLWLVTEYKYFQFSVTILDFCSRIIPLRLVHVPFYFTLLLQRCIDVNSRFGTNSLCIMSKKLKLLPVFQPPSWILFQYLR